MSTPIFDPTGPLARLNDIPALCEAAGTVDLADADPDDLNPYTQENPS